MGGNRAVKTETDEKNMKADTLLLAGRPQAFTGAPISCCSAL